MNDNTNKKDYIELSIIIKQLRKNHKRRMLVDITQVMHIYNIFGVFQYINDVMIVTVDNNLLCYTTEFHNSGSKVLRHIAYITGNHQWLAYICRWTVTEFAN